MTGNTERGTNYNFISCFDAEEALNNCIDKTDVSLLCPEPHQGLHNTLLKGVTTVEAWRGKLCIAQQHDSHPKSLIKLLLLLMSSLPATKTNAESLLRCYFSRRPSNYLGESFYFGFLFVLKVAVLNLTELSCVPFLPWLTSLP